MRLVAAIASLSVLAACSTEAVRRDHARLDGPSATAQLTDDFVDPTTNLPRWESRTGSTFELSSSHDVDTISYAGPRDVSICLTRTTPTAGAEPVGVRVDYDGGATTMVNPGDCARITTQDMSLAATAPLPPGTVVRGRLTAAG